MDGPRKFYQGRGGGGGGPDKVLAVFVFFTSLEKQLDLLSPIAFRGWFIPVILCRPLGTCDFGHPVPPSGITHMS